MAYFILKTRQGDQEFSVNGVSGYLRLNGRQICHNGSFFGPTITCHEDDLEKMARKWWKSYLRKR